MDASYTVTETQTILSPTTELGASQLRRLEALLREARERIATDPRPESEVAPEVVEELRQKIPQVRPILDRLGAPAVLSTLMMIDILLRMIAMFTAPEGLTVEELTTAFESAIEIREEEERKRLDDEDETVEPSQ